MTQPKQTNAIDRRKADAIRLAEIRQRVDTDTTARQEAIANFVLSTAAMAKQLREALDIKATGIDAQAMPRFDDFLNELTHRIRFHFQEKFGRDLFDCPPASEVPSFEPTGSYAVQFGPPKMIDFTETSQQLADHQAALLRAASLHANMTQPVPGWPVVIYTPTRDEDNGYLCAIKKSHPLKLGDVIVGKPVIAVAWRHTPERSDQPVYQLEGDVDWRYFVTAPITRPAAAESMTQPPADGGK